MDTVGMLLNALNFFINIGIIFFVVKIFLYFRKRVYKKAFLSLIGLIMFFILLTYLISTDVNLIKNDQEPKYSLQGMYLKNGGTTQYIGLGYSIWDINSISTKEVGNDVIFGRYEGYQIRFMFITIKEESHFVPQH